MGLVAALPGWTTDVKTTVQPAAKPGSAIVRAARLEATAGATRLILEVTRPARFKAYALAGPNRIVIDLENVAFRLPKDAGATPTGVVAAFRFGLIAPARSRVVIDLKEPARIAKAETIEGTGTSATRIEFTLAAVDQASFVAEAERVPPAIAQRPDARTPAFVAPLSKSAKPVIVIDPGHGGIDSGTTGNLNRAEKDVVLVFSRLLRDALVKSGRYQVLMTRDQDLFVSLEDRVRFAREKGCHLMISIHTDSVPAGLAHLNVRGATVYTASERATDEEARALAEKENLSDVIAGVEVTDDEQDAVNNILVDLMRRETMNNSLAFTNATLGALRQSAALSRDPHRSAAFRVLRAPDVPSVLIELGYLSNPEDEKLLVSKDWQAKVARSIADAVDGYFSKRLARAP